MKLEQKVVILTGASKGIGRISAVQIAKEGAKLVLAARSAGELEEAAREVRDAGGEAIAVQTDVTQEPEVRAMIARTVETFGRIDVLINNAGGSGPIKEVVDLEMEEWDRVMALNLRSAMMCSKYALQHMIPRKSGSIVMISSTAAQRGLPSMADYAAAKFALTGLTRSLAREAGQHNIRVNCLILGHIITPHMEEFFQRRAPQLGVTPDQIKQERTVLSPLNRFTTSEEVAHAMVFMASESASGITGQSIFVASGGWMNLQ